MKYHISHTLFTGQRCPETRIITAKNAREAVRQWLETRDGYRVRSFASRKQDGRTVFSGHTAEATFFVCFRCLAQ